MGLYIEATATQSKEELLYENCGGTMAPQSIDWQTCYAKDCLPVILVDNGLFTAAGVAYDQRELDAFNHPDDHRPKQGFILTIENIRKLTNGRLDSYLEK